LVIYQESLLESSLVFLKIGALRFCQPSESTYDPTLCS